jgi:outer membrane protein assembly factor BamB
VIDDHAFHTVATEDSVYFGSSADDHIYCLEANTGKTRWTFATDGPIRYAPVIHQDRLYAGSDDGHVYCLNMETGSLVWKQRIGPVDRRIPGNGRLISIWPVRTGLVIDRGMLFAVAGLYPSQGVYAQAMEPAEGNVIWRQELDCSPQGYLLASSKLLFIPTGRGNPIALSRSDGHVVARFEGVGGNYAVLQGDELIAGRGNDGSLAVSDSSFAEQFITLRGKHFTATPHQSFLIGGGQLSAVDRTKLRQSQKKGANGKRKPPKFVSPRLWTVDCRGESSVAACDNLVIVGGSQFVVAHDPADGREVWRHEIEGRALDLAITAHRLYVSTDRGRIYCFESGNGTSAPTANRDVFAIDQQRDLAPPPTAHAETLAATAARVLDGSTTKKGYCLVVGVGSGRLAYELALASDLTVVAVDQNLARVREARKALIAAGVYGTRVTVHHVEGEELPFTDFFANVIASETAITKNSPPGWPRQELTRVLRPYGGVLWTTYNDPPYVRGELVGAGSWTHQYANPANTANSGDKLIQRDLQLQWFGGPGPQAMVDRHLRAPSPLVAGGRLFVPGENSLIAVDCYNGTQLWQTELPDTQRYSIPFDCGYMCVDDDVLAIAARSHCSFISTQSGEELRSIPLPTVAGNGMSWGYTALVDGMLYGSAMLPGAARTRPSRNLIDRDYSNDRPLVTSRMLFCFDIEQEMSRWIYQRGVIIHPTITIGDGRIWFVESRNELAMSKKNGRVPLATLLADNAFLVAINADSGDIEWEQPLGDVLSRCRNILYLQYASGQLLGSGSYLGPDDDSSYCLQAFDAATGQPQWHATHMKGKPGEYSHGEQVHHPLILDNIVFAEPVMYELTSGRRTWPEGESAAWFLQRPGHSCGTLSGAGDCVFFRAHNPTLFDVGSGIPRAERFRELSPSRPGCWINIVPAAGLVLIPEASASCVCHYSLQTSMAFLPKRADDSNKETLKN